MWGCVAQYLGSNGLEPWASSLNPTLPLCPIVKTNYVRVRLKSLMAEWLEKLVCLSDMKCSVMMWRSWFRIFFRSNYGCIVLLSYVVPEPKLSFRSKERKKRRKQTGEALAEELHVKVATISWRVMWYDNYNMAHYAFDKGYINPTVMFWQIALH